MPTLSIDKSADPGQETGGGQLRISLPRVRIPVQSIPASRAAIAPYCHGVGAFRWQLVGNRAGLIDSGALVLREARSDGEVLKRRKSAPRKEQMATASREDRAAPAPVLPPAAFAREVLGVRLWEKQEEVLNGPRLRTAASR